MRDRKVRMVFFSLRGSEYHQFEMGWPAFLATLLLALGVLAGVTLGLLWTVNWAYQHHQLAQIERNHQELRARLLQWEQRVHEVASAVESAHTENTNEESLDNWSLPIAVVDADDNIDPVGMPEAPGRVTLGAKASSPERPKTDLLGWLEEQVRHNREVQKTIATRFERDRAEAEHLPSIRPLVSGRITDLFGKREDPFVDRVRHHNGLDIGAPRGTAVHSPAAGFVEFVKQRYRRHRGYGKVVIVDHGYGIKTLYGHLSRIAVRHGQRIDRWQLIGDVGETGRATGPHLHYEVWVDGRAKDPLQFILN